MSLDFEQCSILYPHEMRVVIAGGQGQIHNGLPTSHERVPSICYLSVII